MKRVGLLGGTFDPIHLGHLVLAQDAREAHELDEVLFVVAGDPWQKTDTVVGSALDRLVMTDIGIGPFDWAKVSTVEIDRQGPSYTIDTLEELLDPDEELSLIIGLDQHQNLSTWHRADEIEKFCRVCPMARWLGLSSTIIRRRIAAGYTVRGLIPDGVADYIERYKLYGQGT